MPKLTSHGHAKQLRKCAEWLESKPDFNFPEYEDKPFFFLTYESKADFLAAVEVLKPGRKDVTGDEIRFRVEHPFCVISIRAKRDLICRLVRPAEYEPEPAFEEDKTLGGDQ